jgi:putative phage-type endonuclease
MKLINHKQGSKEWLEMRRKGLGASDAPIIMNVSPYKDQYQLWLEKTTGAESLMNAAMRYGKETEETERQAFEKMVGLTFFPDMSFVSEERPWQIASLDGIDFDQTIIMEIKQANAEDHELAKQGKVPEKYFPQLQHQFAVCRNIKTNIYCSSHKRKVGEDEFGKSVFVQDRRIVEVKPDDAYIEEMIKKEQFFLDEYLLKGRSPPQPWKNKERFFDLAEMIANLDDQLTVLEQEKEKHRKELISLCNADSCKAGRVTLTKTIPLGVVDYKAIPELSGVDLEKYRKPAQERWTLRIA